LDVESLVSLSRPAKAGFNRDYAPAEAARSRAVDERDVATPYCGTASLDYPRADRFEPGGAPFEFTLQCVFEDKLKLEL